MAIAATVTAVAAMLALRNMSYSLLLRRGLQDRQLLGAVGVDRGTKELPRLLGGAALLQLDEDELRRLVGIRIGAVVQPLTGDLSDPRVVILPPVNAIRMEFIREIGVRIGMRRRGERNRRSDDRD